MRVGNDERGFINVAREFRDGGIEGFGVICDGVCVMCR